MGKGKKWKAEGSKYKTASSKQKSGDAESEKTRRHGDAGTRGHGEQK